MFHWDMVKIFTVTSLQIDDPEHCKYLLLSHLVPVTGLLFVLRIPAWACFNKNIRAVRTHFTPVHKIFLSICFHLLSFFDSLQLFFISQTLLRMSFMSEYVECRLMRIIKIQQVKQALFEVWITCFWVWQTWLDLLSLAETCFCSDWNPQHKLPVHQRADFEILMLVYEALNGLELKYAADLRLHCKLFLLLKSSGSDQVCVPTTRTRTRHEKLHASWICCWIQTPLKASVNTVCVLLFYLCPCSWIVFWSVCKSSNSTSKITLVLKCANRWRAHPLVCCDLLSYHLCASGPHCVCARTWPSSGRRFFQPSRVRTTWLMRGWICGKHLFWWQICGPQLTRSKITYTSDNRLYIRGDVLRFTQAGSRGDRVAHHFIKQNLRLQLWAEE